MLSLDANIIALVVIALANLITAIVQWRMKGAIIDLKHNTNSIKDQLVKVTSEASEAKGILLGRAQIIQGQPPANGVREEKQERTTP